MRTTELKTKLVEIINTSDERFLRMVNTLYQTYKEGDSDVVAYTVQGQSLDKKEYIKQIKEAENQIERGEFIAVEDLEKESANW